MFNLEDIDIENIFFVEPKRKSTGYHSYFFYDNEPLMVKTSEYFVNKINSKEIVLCNNSNYFSHFLKQLEIFAKREIMLNSEKWFNGKKFEEEVLEGLFKSNFIDNKLVLNTTKNSVYFDKNNKKVSYTDIKKNDKIVCMVYIKGLWFEKSQYGFLTEVVQSKFCAKPRPKILYPQECLISDKLTNTILYDSEEETQGTQEVPEVPEVPEKKLSKDSDPVKQIIPNVPDSDLEEQTEEINCEEEGEVIFF